MFVSLGPPREVAEAGTTATGTLGARGSRDGWRSNAQGQRRRWCGLAERIVCLSRKSCISVTQWVFKRGGFDA